jgi:hypothetical protein
MQGEGWNLLARHQRCRRQQRQPRSDILVENHEHNVSLKKETWVAGVAGVMLAEGSTGSSWRAGTDC